MRRMSVSMILIVVMSLITVPGIAWAQADRSVADVMWTWGVGAEGTSTLVRTDSGISATYRAEGLPEGQAITLWFIVFNNPSACADNPCSVEDLFDPDVQGDFLFGAGHVIGESGRANFGGSLKVGDVSGSGFAEMGFPELAVGLQEPREAEVHLALHSHGPALTGQTLKAQISSFLGGCTSFLGGADGIADGPGDVPDASGECSTIQASVHIAED